MDMTIQGRGTGLLLLGMEWRNAKCQWSELMAMERYGAGGKGRCWRKPTRSSGFWSLLCEQL